MLTLPSRRVLALALILIAVGGALIVLQYLGTFDSQQCVPDRPSLCFDNPDPWPGAVGSALAMAGLVLLAAGLLGEARAKKRKVKDTVSTSGTSRADAPSAKDDQKVDPAEVGPSRQDATLEN